MPQDYFAIKVAPTSQATAEAGTNNDEPMTPLRTKQLVDTVVKEPGGALNSMYVGLGTSTGGDNEAEARGNVIIGHYAGEDNGLVQDPVGVPPAIFDSTIIGAGAGQRMRGGVGTTAVGRYACQSAVGIGNNTAVGDSALRFCLTGGNGAFGYITLENLTTGEECNAFGRGALHELTTAD
jgi:hypothetical protein